MGASWQTRLQRARLNLAATLKTRTRQLFKEFRIILRALVHPGVPWYAKLMCGCTVCYVASPIQLIPNFIPILGQMDDVLMVGIAIRVLKRSVPPSVLEECHNGPDPFAGRANAGENALALSAAMKLAEEEAG